MSARVRRARTGMAVAIWLGLAGALWLGIYDFVNTRAHEEYLRRSAELRLGIQPPPGVPVDMREVLSAGRRNAGLQASIWAAIVAAAGLITVRLLAPARPTAQSSLSDHRSSIP